MVIRLLKIVMAIGLIVITGHNHLIHAQEEAETIKKLKVDLNGNGNTQTVLLMGEDFDDGTDYYRDIWLKVPTLADKEDIHYGGGYNPSLKIINDKANQNPLFIFKSKKEKRSIYTSHFYNKDKGKIKLIPMPRLEYIGLAIKDDFTIEIKTTPTIQPIQANIESAPKGIKDKLFDQNGDASENASLWLSPDTKYEVASQEQNNVLSSSIPVRIQNKNGQLLGFIFTKWRFSNDKWINIETNWKHAKNDK